MHKWLQLERHRKRRFGFASRETVKASPRHEGPGQGKSRPELEIEVKIIYVGSEFPWGIKGYTLPAVRRDSHPGLKSKLGIRFSTSGNHTMDHAKDHAMNHTRLLAAE